MKQKGKKTIVKSTKREKEIRILEKVTEYLNMYKKKKTQIICVYIYILKKICIYTFKRENYTLPP